jgi:hypothetical protein
LAEGVCINEVVIAFKSHPLSLVKCSREELHAIKPIMIRSCRRMPVRVGHGVATCLPDPLLVIVLIPETFTIGDPELSYWWTGLRDEDDDKQWVWETSGDPMTYSDWHPSAAPDHNGFNCMQLLSGTFYEGQWMTFECYDDFIDTHALCQLKDGSGSTATPTTSSVGPTTSTTTTLAPLINPIPSPDKLDEVSSCKKIKKGKNKGKYKFNYTAKLTSGS